MADGAILKMPYLSNSLKSIFGMVMTTLKMQEWETREWKTQSSRVENAGVKMQKGTTWLEITFAISSPDEFLLVLV